MLLDPLAVELLGCYSARMGFGLGKDRPYLGPAILAFNQANENRHPTFVTYLCYRRHNGIEPLGISQQGALI